MNDLLVSWRLCCADVKNSQWPKMKWIQNCCCISIL